MGEKKSYAGAMDEIPIPGCNVLRACSSPTEAANKFAREYMDDQIEREAQICVVDDAGNYWLSDAELTSISTGWWAHDADGPLTHREAYDQLRLPAEDWESHCEYLARMTAAAEDQA